MRTFRSYRPISCDHLPLTCFPPLFTAAPAYGLREGSTVALWEQSSGSCPPEDVLIEVDSRDTVVVDKLR